MPIYVYECDGCNGRFEYQQSMSEPPKTACESCGGKLQKVIVPIAFHLKGGGWYKDLYSSQKSGGGESKGESKTETKTESKAETPAASKPSGGGGEGT